MVFPLNNTCECCGKRLNAADNLCPFCKRPNRGYIARKRLPVGFSTPK